MRWPSTRLMKVLEITLSIGLGGFLLWAAFAKGMSLWHGGKVELSRALWITYFVAGAIELLLGVGLLAPRTRLLAAWITMWAFAGIGVASWAFGVVNGAITCNCLGANTSSRTAIVLDGIICIVASVVYALRRSSVARRSGKAGRSVADFA